MEKYMLTETQSSPSVVLDPSGVVELKGVSISENSTDFYGPILDWVEEYGQNPNPETHLDFCLEYLDSGSLGFINLVLDKFNNIHKTGKSNIFLKWSYETDDLDMEEFGSDLKQMFQFNVELVPIEFDK